MTQHTLESYSAAEHLVQIRAKDGTLKDYLPANWRIYELRLKHPNITIESEIVHMDPEHNLVVVKAWIFDGKTYAESERRASAYKQGLLSALDKVETGAKARAARDFGISTELALDMDEETSAGQDASEQLATINVPGQSNWPQNPPFDVNLALIFAGNTCLLGKSTTHKTPQSADLFAIWLRGGKAPSSSSTWPQYQSQWTLFASISGDFCRDRVQYQQSRE